MGCLEAIGVLSDCYKEGCGIEKDEKKAFELSKKAADLGEPMSMCDLGIMYEYGKGVKKDEDEAFYYYKKAADSGYLPALIFLSSCYESGVGTLADRKKAEDLKKIYDENFDQWQDEQMKLIEKRVEDKYKQGE